MKNTSTILLFVLIAAVLIYVVFKDKIKDYLPGATDPLAPKNPILAAIDSITNTVSNSINNTPPPVHQEQPDLMYKSKIFNSIQRIYSFRDLFNLDNAGINAVLSKLDDTQLADFYRYVKAIEDTLHYWKVYGNTKETRIYTTSKYPDGRYNSALAKAVGEMIRSAFGNPQTFGAIFNIYPGEK